MNQSIDKEVLKRLIKKEKAKQRYLKEVAVLVVVLIILVLLLKVIFGVAIVEGNSMQPYLSNKSGTFFYRLTKEYQVDDIVIFPQEKDLLIKRIVGVEGDTIDIDNQTGILYVNGVQENRLGISNTYTVEDGISFPLVVGKDEVFVLGDNRRDSKDSRYFGLVSTNQIKGKVIFKWSTIKRLQKADN